MDIEFLKTTIGPVLIEAISEVMHSRPADAIEFISDFIFNYQFTSKKRQETELAAQKMEEEKKRWLERRVKERKEEQERIEKVLAFENSSMKEEDELAESIRAEIKRKIEEARRAEEEEEKEEEEDNEENEENEEDDDGDDEEYDE